jgi:large subunit ribosomal protein L2
MSQSIKIINSNPINNSSRFGKTVLAHSWGNAATPTYLVHGVNKTGGRNSHGKLTMNGIGGCGGQKKHFHMNKYHGFRTYKAVKVFRVQSKSASVVLWMTKDLFGPELFTIAVCSAKVISADHSLIYSDVDLDHMTKYDRNSNTTVRLPIKFIKVGTRIFDVERSPGAGGTIAVSAGSYATIMDRSNFPTCTKILLPSGQSYFIDSNCFCTIGSVGSKMHNRMRLSKAGHARGRGSRSKVRGSCMNACDHPHGGGEGRSGPGRPSVTPFAKVALGQKTVKTKRVKPK